MTPAEQGQLKAMRFMILGAVAEDPELKAKLADKYEKPDDLREQLIDVAGVAVQWASQLTPEPEFVVSIEDRDNGDGTVSVTAHVEADHEGPNLR